jgi:23S rRNA (adenine2503-C2)-methyltransferase
MERFFQSIGEPTYRVNQLWQGLYNNLWNSPAQFTNLPKNLRRRLQEDLIFDPLSEEKTITSRDGLTTKTLFRLPDGLLIESVLMQYDRRYAVCVSSQVGCAVGCIFCATGQMGLRRNLSQGEIIAQMLHFARALNVSEQKVHNIVFMGMGEPFHNFEAVMAAVETLNSPDGFHLGARNFTISTVGIVPFIEKLSRQHPQVNLSISLHAADDKLREQLIPCNRRYPLKDLIAVCRQYLTSTHRRITFEWVMMDGYNDSLDDAKQLARLLKGLLCHVNLIPLNPVPGFAGKPSRPENMHKFKAYLDATGLPCTVRLGRGIDIRAGCGQLAAREPGPPTVA